MPSHTPSCPDRSWNKAGAKAPMDMGHGASQSALCQASLHGPWLISRAPARGSPDSQPSSLGVTSQSTGSPWPPYPSPTEPVCRLMGTKARSIHGKHPPRSGDSILNKPQRSPSTGGLCLLCHILGRAVSPFLGGGRQDWAEGDLESQLWTEEDRSRGQRRRWLSRARRDSQLLFPTSKG